MKDGLPVFVVACLMIASSLIAWRRIKKEEEKVRYTVERHVDDRTDPLVRDISWRIWDQEAVGHPCRIAICGDPDSADKTAFALNLFDAAKLATDKEASGL